MGLKMVSVSATGRSLFQPAARMSPHAMPDTTVCAASRRLQNYESAIETSCHWENLLSESCESFFLASCCRLLSNRALSAAKDT